MKWFLFCFRRASPDGKFCSVHDTLNDSKREFRLGQKVRTAMIKDEKPRMQNWHRLKQQIKQYDRWDDDRWDDDRWDDDAGGKKSNHRCDAEAESANWKESLINRIKNSRDNILNRNLSYCRLYDEPLAPPKPVDWEKEILSKSNWGEIVTYILSRFGNQSERSIRIESIFSWLSMAEDWFEFEFIFRTPDSLSINKVAKGSSLPRYKLIYDLCVQEPGITKQEIARRLNESPQTIGQYTKRYPELEAFF